MAKAPILRRAIIQRATDSLIRVFGLLRNLATQYPTLLTLMANDMVQNTFPHGFDPTTSILFLGAGFSASATNRINGNPPVGGGLESEIKKLALLPNDDPSGLQDLSTYAVKQGKDVFSLLCDLYTITKLSPEQEIILSQPWFRIYTTNYDDVVEAFRKSKKASENPQTYSTESQVPNQFRPGSIVHLHGYIHECTRENLLRQLVLSHYSYAQQRAIQSPWWDVFERDLRVAKNIFFVGYDLKDFEPAKYLTQNPLAVEKTHFILRPTQSPVAESRLDEYGRRDPMGVSGFAEECKACVIAEKPDHANALSAFRFVELLKDDKVPARPTPLEIQSLFAFGKFIFQRLLATFPRPAYTVPRDQALSQCMAALPGCRTLILHSKIGNGKTIFRQGLAIALTEQGHSCFELREKVTPTPAEIDFIATQPKPVIIFPDYDTAYSNIHLFAGLNPDARFIVEIVTGTLQVRHSEVFDRLPKPIERVDLNRLSADDCRTIYKLLDEAGIAPRDFNSKFGNGAEMRDIILSVFENADLIKRIDGIVQPVLANGDAKAVLFCSAILKALGLHTDPAFLRSFSGVDAYQVLCEAGEGAYEFVDFAHDRVEPHSALFSEFLIKRYLKPHEVVGVVFRMASEAARRMNEDGNPQSERVRSARATLGALLRFGFLDELLHQYPDRDQHISQVYEHGRRDTYIQGEPLFWLQYSIFMQEIGRWDLAERHMETAYQRGAARPGFLTYQLDTNSLGLCLDLELRAGNDAQVSRAEQILGLLAKSREMIGNGNHRGHTLKMLRKLEPFLQQRKAGLSKAEGVGFVYQINLIVDVLDGMPADDKAEWGTETVKDSLKRAVGILVR